MPQVFCIIPVYNEGPRIANVLRSVVGHPQVAEVIVVDGGSTDNTRDVVSQFKDVIFFRQNPDYQGKTRAVAEALERSNGDLIFLLDSDLTDLTQSDITALIEPVLSGKADYTISLRKNSPLIDRMIGIDLFSGDRVFSKAGIMPYLSEMTNLPAYGLESYLNSLIIKNNYRLKIVFWKNVRDPWKREKRGWLGGLKGDWRMIKDILRVILPWEIAYQFVMLRRLDKD